MSDSDTIRRRVEELLDKWENRRAIGEDLSAEELCRNDPDCLAAVRNAVSRLTRIDRFLGTNVQPAGESDPVSRSMAPESIGDYVILGEIARGGSAIVYRARQESLGRDVAVKLIRASDRPEHTLRRFERETRALARLSNRFIAGVIDAGIVELGRGPQPYLVMEFVDGLPLDIFLQHGSLVNQQERLQLFLKICEGIQVAHSQRVIHRDIKPSNILVTLDGNPHVCDFGIARILDFDTEDATEPALTKSSEIIGTLQYMSPEHITGPHKQIDAQADVYSLGMILYEMVTGLRPYDTREQTVFEAIETVRETTAPLIRQADSSLDRDLETIVARAVEKDRAARYRTVDALASDITSYLADRPIQARRVRWPELAWRWCRRNRAVAMSLLAVFVSMFAGLAASMYYGVQADSHASQSELNEKEAQRLATESQARLVLLNAEMKKSETQRARAEANETRSRRSAFNALLGNIQKMVASDPYLARLWLEDPVRCPPDWRGFSWKLLRECAERSAVELAGHTSGTKVVSFSRDGTKLASIGADGGLKMWDVPLAELKAEFADAGLTRKSILSPDGRHILGMTEAGLARILTTEDGKVVSERSPKAAQVLSVGWTELSDSILLGTRDGTVEVWPLTAEEPSHLFQAGTTGIAWVMPTSRDEIASVSVAGEFRITRLSDGFLMRNDTLPDTRQIKRVGLVPGGRQLAVAPTSDFVHSFELPNALIKSSTAIRERIYGLEVTEFPARYLVACRRRIRILLPGFGEAGTQRHEFHTVTGFDFARKKNLAAISGDAGNIWLLEIGDRSPWSARVNHTAPVTHAACFPDRDEFVTTDQSGRAVLARGIGGEFLADISLPQLAPIRAAAVRPDGKQLALAGAKAVALIGVEGQRLTLDKLLPAETTLLGVAYSPNGSSIAAAGRDGTVYVWDAATQQKRHAFLTDSPALSIQFRPKSSELIVGHRLGRISIWNLDSGKREAAWGAHAGKVIDLSVTRDGSRLFSCGGDELICCWDLQTRVQLRILAGHRARVSSLALSPDEKTLASGGHDRQLLIWDAETGELQLQFTAAQGDRISSLSFFRGGESLVSTGMNDVHTRVWTNRELNELETGINPVREKGDLTESDEAAK